VKHSEVFKKGEQGLLNYVARWVHNGDLTIHNEPFMVWPGESARAERIQLEELISEGWKQ